MKQYLFIAILFFAACSDRKKNIQTITDTDGIQQTQQYSGLPPLDNIKSDIFKIAGIDTLENKIQRIFVVISPKNANDTSIIRQIIGVLKASYPLDNKSSISFFSEKKYANYKAVLFIDGKHLLPKTEYQNWKDNYYLGEYNLENMKYKTFPVSSRWDRQKTYSIDPAPKMDSKHLTKHE
jgi:hypothetical protein